MVSLYIAFCMTFIDALPVSDDARRKLASLGALTPRALAALLRASRGSMARWLGPGVAEAVLAYLEAPGD